MISFNSKNFDLKYLHNHSSTSGKNQRFEQEDTVYLLEPPILTTCGPSVLALFRCRQNDFHPQKLPRLASSISTYCNACQTLEKKTVGIPA